MGAMFSYGPMQENRADRILLLALSNLQLRYSTRATSFAGKTLCIHCVVSFIRTFDVRACL